MESVSSLDPLIRSIGALAAMTVLLVACEGSAITLPLPPLLPASPGEVTLTVRALGPEGGVAGARVCATRPSEQAERCAVANDAGESVFRVVPGIYLVRGDPPEGRRLRTIGATQLDVAESRDATLLFESVATLSGAIRASDGRPVAGAEVCAHPASHAPIVCERSRGDGSFAIDARAGIYKLHVDGPRDGSRLMAQWAVGRLESFEADTFDTRTGDAAGIDLALVRGHALSGTVRAERDGSPVEEAQVCTSSTLMPLPWACERTDEDGHYSALRETGSYWVWVIPPDDAGRLVPQRYDRVDLGVNATPFTIDRDRVLDVSLREGPLLIGRLTTEDGAPLKFALVCVDTPFPTGRICRPSGANGDYSVALRPDVYTVQVIPTGDSLAVSSYHSRKRNWIEADRVRVSGDTRLDVELALGVRFYGTVRTEDGIPVEAAPVSINDARGFLVGTYTDASGHYELAVVPGPYTVDVFAPRVSQLVSRLGMPTTIDAEIGLDVVLEFARP